MKKNVVKRILSYCGIVGPITYVSVLVILSSLWPGYSHVSQLMSELGSVEAPHKIIMNTLGFPLLGLMFIGFSATLYDNIQGGKFKFIGPALVVLSGIGLILSGVFPCDPGCIDVTFTGHLHSSAAMLAALPMSFAPMGVSPYLSKRLDIYSVISGILTGAVSMLNTFPQYTPIQGALQRMGIGISLIWMEVLSFNMLRTGLRNK